MTKHLLSVLAFMVVSFATQGLSHFVINADHFDAVSFMRPDPVIPMGLLAMIVQGATMSFALQKWRRGKAVFLDGLCIALIFGVFLVSYIALAEPAKYLVPSISAWTTIEVLVGLVQFTLFGLLLGLIHRDRLTAR